MERPQSHHLFSRLYCRRLGGLARRGYSLIELMVVAAIIGVVAVIVISNQGSFNRSILLANTAYDVALSLLSSQTYGIGSKGLTVHAGCTPSENSANAGFGLEFSSTNTTSYIMFADTNPTAATNATRTSVTCTPGVKPGDNMYNSGADTPDTLVKTYTLNGGMKMSNFCVYDSVSGKWCLAGASGPLTKVDIVFTRPNTQANIRAAMSGGWISGGWQSACITLTSPSGGTRGVNVTQIGQITTVATCP